MLIQVRKNWVFIRIYAVCLIGKPTEVLESLLKILYEKFGGTVNSKGFKVLDKHVRIIQGDGINLKSIEEILDHIEKLGFSADNLVFGSGGKLTLYVYFQFFGYL